MVLLQSPKLVDKGSNPLARAKIIQWEKIKSTGQIPVKY